MGEGRAYYQPVFYYLGPAADTERLEEELLARAEEIFGGAVRVLHLCIFAGYEIILS